MIYDFNTLPDRTQTESLKWNAFGPDVLPMWVADMDFISPEPVLRALRARVEHGVFGYPVSVTNDPHSLPEFRQVIVDRMLARYQWKIEPEAIVFIPGVVTGLNLACHSLDKDASSVLVQTPVYPPFLSAGRHAGLERSDATLARNPDGTYQIDWDAFEAAIRPDTGLFILCNPHNPVGRVFQPAELERMAEICLRHDVLICSDEIHSDLIFDGRVHTPTASLSPEIASRTITLIAPSKTYNLAGLDCSLAIIPDRALRKKYMSGGKGLVGWVNVMGLVAGEAAYRDGQEWLDQLLSYLQANRDALYDFVCAQLPQLSLAKPEGTYLAWLDCRQAGIGDQPAEFFLKEARVALNEGSTFGPGGAGFARLNFGCPRSMLMESLGRMKAALDGCR